MITPKNLVKHELTGLKVEIVKSSDPSKVGIKGTVAKETMGLIIIDTGKGKKSVPKKECAFRFFLDKAVVDVDGKALIGRPEDRIKKQQIEKW